MRKLRHEEIPRLNPAAAASRPRHPISVVVDQVRSIYNVGSIFRTSDAAWVEHVYLTGITGTPDHRGLRKTALGAQDTVAWSHVRDARPLLEGLKRAGYTIAVLEITDAPTPFEAVGSAHFPLCLVLGNEVDGVDSDLVALADLAFEIPQYGTKQSLNVAVAYGIAVYELIRRYQEVSAGRAAPAGSLPSAATFRSG